MDFELNCYFGIKKAFILLREITFVLKCKIPSFLCYQEMRKKREEELDALQSKLSEMNASIEQNELEIKKSLAEIQQVCLSFFTCNITQWN